MSLSQLQQISDISFQVDSPANAANGAGVVYIPDIEVNGDYIGTLDFYIYDLNADTGYTGEPFLVTQGTTSVSREGEQFFIYVQRELNLLADGDGSLSFEIQFQDQSDPLQPNFVINDILSLSEQLELFEAQRDSSGPIHRRRNHGAPDATFSTDPNDPEVEIKLDPGVLPQQPDATFSTDPNDPEVEIKLDPGVLPQYPDATFSTDPNDPEVEIKLDPGVLPQQPDATFSTNPNDPEVEIKLDPGVLPTDKTEEEYLESQRAALEETERQEEERLRELAARQARELAEQEARELAEQQAAQEAAERAAEEKRVKRDRRR